MAPLRYEGVNLGFWTDFYGNRQTFFHGNHIGEHICQCGEDNSCVDSAIEDFACNCDANNPVWESDVGRITAREILPITKMNYGPLEFDIERANFTIGRLQCSGNNGFK